jgi:hypothetical protein
VEQDRGEGEEEEGEVEKREKVEERGMARVEGSRSINA